MVVGRGSRCGACAIELDEDPGAPLAERRPCPSCGSKVRALYINIVETVIVRSRLRLKGRHPGGGKPFAEQIVADDLQRSNGKWMKLSRMIDRANDLYREVVTNPATGEVVHSCEEPLSEHRKHGSDKRQ